MNAPIHICFSGGDRRGAQAVPKRLRFVSQIGLGLLLFAACGFGQTRPAGIRVSTWVREDVFAGFLSDDMARFEKGQEKIAEIMKSEGPDKYEAIAWRGGSVLFLAARAHKAGNTREFARLKAEAEKHIAEAAEFVKANPRFAGIHAILGGSYVVSADKMPEAYRKESWTKARHHYTMLKEAQKDVFEKLPLHHRGEVMSGLAQAAQRLGETDTSRKLVEELITALPGTPYAAFGKRWLEKPETAARSSLTCATCHEPGRLKL